MNPGVFLLDLFFPPKCPYCCSILEQPRLPVCPDCRKKLPWLTGRSAGRKVDFTKGCFSPLSYRETVPDAVRRYKFGRMRAYGIPFGTLMAQCLHENLPDGADLITWCPLSRKRLRDRGFDQAQLLAETVGKLTGIPTAHTLKKIRHTPAQSDLEEDSARRANAMGAYAILPKAAVKGRRVVLVDDVVTSGATLSECAGLLLRAGAKEVYGLTLAQARGD